MCNYLITKFSLPLLYTRRRKWQPTLVPLPGESHGQRSLVGYIPQGRKESDTTERLHFTVYLGFPRGSVHKESTFNAGEPGSITGSGTSPREGNGNRLQYLCLVNPMDRGAWWPVERGVTKNWTQLSH